MLERLLLRQRPRLLNPAGGRGFHTLRTLYTGAPTTDPKEVIGDHTAVNPPSEYEHYDLVVVGGGMVGAAMTCMLGTSPVLKHLRILMLDAAKGPPTTPTASSQYGNRVVALRPASTKLLQDMHVWDAITEVRAKEYTSMQVWDSISAGSIEFSAKQVGYPYLGTLVENDLVQSALLDQIKQYSHVTTEYNSRVESFDWGDEDVNSSATINLASGRSVTTRLVIGADGANSFARRSAGLEHVGWNYAQGEHGHWGVVGTIEVENRGVNDTAWQRFLPTGPVAMLPLSDTTSSLVWSTTQPIAKELCAMTETEFVDALNSALTSDPDSHFPFTMDKVLTPWRQPSPPPPMGAPPVAISVGDKSRGMFPLGLGHSVHYVRKRLALIGDAAHRMHPLAGQGVNVGFNDVKVLVDVLNTSVDLGEDIGSIHQLMGYEATTQRANVPMLMATDGLKRLFSSDYGPLAFLRGVGLNATNGVEPLKTALMRHAMGL